MDPSEGWNHTQWREFSGSPMDVVMQSLIPSDIHPVMPQCGSAIRALVRHLRAPAQHIPPRTAACSTESEWFIGAINIEALEKLPLTLCPVRH